MISYKDDRTTYRLPKTGEEQIPTYVKAVNFLLITYATCSIIAEAVLDIVCLKIASMKASVKFAKVLRSKVVRCGNAHPEERTKRKVIDGLPANIQSAIRMF